MFDYQIFGESHGKAIGVLITHLPAGLSIDDCKIAEDLLRRQSRGGLSTERIEKDEVEYLSGVFRGKTTGMPLLALIHNHDVDDSAYDSSYQLARPGHADYTAYVQSNGYRDYRGGGHISGRLTAPLVVAGSLAKSFLKNEFDINIHAEIVEEEILRKRALEAKKLGDSVGGQIICTIHGCKPGLGGPDLQDCLESEIARQIFSIPAVKAIGFGDGEKFAELLGSQANDVLRVYQGQVKHVSNHSGGINGGISNGENIVFTVTFRPTPSIEKTQNTINLETFENAEISIQGRHDSCIVLRASPIVEAAAALAICQFVKSDTLLGLRQEIDFLDGQIKRLLAERFSICEEIGQLKKEKNIPIYNGEREQEIFERILQGPYSDEMKKVYQTIFECSKEIQH